MNNGGDLESLVIQDAIDEPPAEHQDLAQFGSPNSGTILPFRGDQRSFLGAEYRRLTILSACQGESSSMCSPMLLT